ncbi:bifunctional ADP-dependent NAD(P)H-hydrate dehydratase/NAD(P)H-hydrate epimerase [Fusibacter sp. 3D3]|uniref:bifunctional ADP-dependent NAD(P)H-hydrate dehydratase/NAD(P)H-hydrate epimerase n=1 Tax=Fusibacter sp. 3D3 TaxID=1048380 RepID=UPI0008531908|nr:bifunctional ADP-dependent NAD(P)H-hydrate dehydratase/NAD(P)H-hydrate epimerase [Fusibacter sp. 3D3]GAU77998.1 NAD(P)HX epimerase [Fusibacter sp. 3D3]
MKIATEKDIRAIDLKAVEKYQIPQMVLMENAGIALAEEVKKHVNKHSKIIIVVGMGNNGGDGLVCARHLHNESYGVKIFMIGNLKKLSEHANRNFEIIKHLSITVEMINDIGGVKKLGKTIAYDDVVVDCIFGIGITKDVEGVYELAIDEINESKGYIISCDIPSGIHASEGLVMKTAVRAHKTVALCLPKVGNIMYPAAEYNGELVVKKIAIPKELIAEMIIPLETISHEMVKQMIPKRPKNSHKGLYGKASIIAGSFGMTGAAILCGKSALRSGVGLLKLIIPESLHAIITTSVPEAVTVPLAETRKGVFGINQVEKLVQTCDTADVIAIGPGCGQNAELNEILRHLVTLVDKPVIIDADGLNTLARNVDVLGHKKNEVVLTPHPGEMSRLTNLPLEVINLHPITTARDFAKKWKVIVVLKGARTVIALPSGQTYININGNPGMATAGSGDVLTGIITSLVAQGLSPEKAAVAGVYIHGYSGDLMVSQKGEYGLIAGDLIEGITQAFKHLELDV